MLNIIDMSMSTYIDDSNLSLINNNMTNRLDSLLEIVLLKSIDICLETNGSFDVTIAPLVQAYGFGPETNSRYNSTICIKYFSFIYLLALQKFSMCMYRH